jgi:hypothetical protein
MVHCKPDGWLLHVRMAGDSQCTSHAAHMCCVPPPGNSPPRAFPTGIFRRHVSRPYGLNTAPFAAGKNPLEPPYYHAARG